MKTLTMLGCAAVVTSTLMSPPAFSGAEITTELVASGLAAPMLVTHAPGDAERIFIVLRGGSIRIMENGSLLPTPFLTINEVDTTFEGGLFALAFHPDYDTNGRFYVHYTADGTGGFSLTTTIREYTVSQRDPNVADPSSARTILTQGQPAANHNAGTIAFSPVDGYLYIPLGDGGNSGNGQNNNTLLSKVLRLDVDGDDFPADDERNYAIPADNPFVGDETLPDEVWAQGLRNPFRSSFDRMTGDLWIADVGAGSFEEVNFQPASSAGGENYAWPCREGFSCGFGGCCNDPGFTDPVVDYSHAIGNSITGGYVYRGCAIPELQGTYFYADFGSGRIWALEYDGKEVTSNVEVQDQLDPPGGASIGSIAGFGEDAFGEIYICDLFGGEVFKIVPVNGNGGCDPADLNLDGSVDGSDLLILLNAWGTAGATDLDDDGTTAGSDLLILLNAWG